MSYWSDEYGKLEPVFDQSEPPTTASFAPSPAPPAEDPRLSMAVRQAGGGEGSQSFMSTLLNGMRFNQGYGGGGMPPGMIGPNTLKLLMSRAQSRSDLENALAERQFAHGLDIEKAQLQRRWSKEDEKTRLEKLRIAMGGGMPGGAAAPSGSTRAPGPTATPSAPPGSTSYAPDPRGGDFAGLSGPQSPSAPTPPATPQSAAGGAPGAVSGASAVDREMYAIDQEIAAYRRRLDAAVGLGDAKLLDATKSELSRLERRRNELMDQRKSQSAFDKELDKARAERTAAAEKAQMAYGGIGYLVNNMRQIPIKMRETWNKDGKGPTGTFGQRYNFDATIGPETNVELPGFMGGAKVGALFPWLAMPENSFGETRAAITSSGNAINLQLKSLVQEAGDGTWSEGDQETVNKLLGEVLQADDENEYNRRLDMFMDNLKGILVTKGVDPRVIEQQFGGSPGAATQVAPQEQTQNVAANDPTTIVATAVDRYKRMVAANPEKREELAAKFKQRFGKSPDEAEGIVAPSSNPGFLGSFITPAEKPAPTWEDVPKLGTRQKDRDKAVMGR